SPDLRHLQRIALDPIAVVIRHVEEDTATRLQSARRRDDRSRLPLEPAERFTLIVPKGAAETSPGDKRLEETCGRRGPDALAVVATVVKAKVKDQCAHSGLLLRLLPCGLLREQLLGLGEVELVFELVVPGPFGPEVLGSVLRVVPGHLGAQGDRRGLTAPGHLIPGIAVFGVAEQTALAQEQLDVRSRCHEREAEQVLPDRGRLLVVSTTQAAKRDEIDRYVALDPTLHEDAAQNSRVRVRRA